MAGKSGKSVIVSRLRTAIPPPVQSTSSYSTPARASVRVRVLPHPVSSTTPARADWLHGGGTNRWGELRNKTMNITNVKIDRVMAFADSVDLVVHVDKASIEALGATVEAGKAGALVHIRIPAGAWDAWRTAAPDSFPQWFGSMSIELDSVELVASKDPLKKGFFRGVGFRPVAAPVVGGFGMLESFEKLSKYAKKEENDAPKAF